MDTLEECESESAGSLYEESLSVICLWKALDRASNETRLLVRASLARDGSLGKLQQSFSKPQASASAEAQSPQCQSVLRVRLAFGDSRAEVHCRAALWQRVKRCQEPEVCRTACGLSAADSTQLCNAAGRLHSGCTQFAQPNAHQEMVCEFSMIKM